MTFSQYFGALPPFYQATANQTLAPFNLYQIGGDITVYLPEISEADGEWVLLINTDIPGINRIEEIHGIRPLVQVKKGDVGIKLNTLTGSDIFESKLLRAGSAAIFIRLEDCWILIQLDLSDLLDARVADLRLQIEGERIKIATSSFRVSTFEKRLDTVEGIIFIRSFDWFGVEDLAAGNVIKPPETFPLDNISYWSFDIDDSINFPNIFYDVPSTVPIIIRITNNDGLSNNILKLKKPDGNHTLSGGQIENNAHVFRTHGLYRLRYSSFVRKYILESFSEADLPKPTTLFEIVKVLAEQIQNLSINSDLPFGNEFPRQPTINTFRIDGGDRYPKGIYIYDGNNWIAQF